MKTVYVGMSGGVDSSLSAVLLKEQGYHVVGIYMKNWSKDLPGMKCPWAEDLADAKRVAVKLGIDFKVFDFETEYRQKVVDYMLSEFKKGNTPNPDIMCNQEIKFKLFYDVAREQGADLIATGHYARTGMLSPSEWRESWAKLRSSSERCAPWARLQSSSEGHETWASAPERSEEEALRPCHLLRAVDENKDQTYFLYRISKDAIAHTLFPIGEMTKPEVKKLAAKYGLHNAYKKESMGVCFVGNVGMKDFLKEFLPEQKPGEIRDIETDKVLGFHDGAVFYTLGQRHGLDVGGGLPYYVVKKDLKKNIVYVSTNLNASELWTDELKLKDIVWRGGELQGTSSDTPRPTGSGRSEGSPVTTGRAERSEEVTLNSPVALFIRLRHRAPLLPATFDGKSVKFPEKIKQPAPGQSVVFYGGKNSEICLGGGIIA